MVQLIFAGLLVLVAVASVLTLIDCCIRGRFVFERIERQQLLLDAGFVPVADAADLRQRVRFEVLAAGAAMGGRLSEHRYLARSRHPAPQPLAQLPRQGASANGVA